MNRNDLKELLDFATLHNMLHCNVISVIKAWKSDMQDYYEDRKADMEIRY